MFVMCTYKKLPPQVMSLTLTSKSLCSYTKPLEKNYENLNWLIMYINKQQSDHAYINMETWIQIREWVW